MLGSRMLYSAAQFTRTMRIRMVQENGVGSAPDDVPITRAAPMGNGTDEQVDKAADMAEQNSRHAIDAAQRLSYQLRAAEQRIADLEAEAEAYRQQAERAEQWLHKVYTEIEDRFPGPDPRRGAGRH